MFKWRAKICMYPYVFKYIDVNLVYRIAINREVSYLYYMTNRIMKHFYYNLILGNVFWGSDTQHGFC